MKKPMSVMFGLLIALTSAAFAADAELGLEVGKSEAVEAMESSQAQPTLAQEEAVADVPTNDCETESFLVPSFLEEITPKSAGWSGICGSCSGVCANRSVGAPCSVLAGNGRCYPKFEDTMCPQGSGLWCECSGMLY